MEAAGTGFKSSGPDESIDTLPCEGAVGTSAIFGATVTAVVLAGVEGGARVGGCRGGWLSEAGTAFWSIGGTLGATAIPLLIDAFLDASLCCSLSDSLLLPFGTEV